MTSPRYPINANYFHILHLGRHRIHPQQARPRNIEARADRRNLQSTALHPRTDHQANSPRRPRGYQTPGCRCGHGSDVRLHLITFYPLFHLISLSLRPQSHVHDNARSAEAGFHHHHLLHVGMFQGQPKDEGRVPHLDQVISCRRNLLLNNP